MCCYLRSSCPPSNPEDATILVYLFVLSANTQGVLSKNWQSFGAATGAGVEGWTCSNDQAVSHHVKLRVSSVGIKFISDSHTRRNWRQGRGLEI